MMNRAGLSALIGGAPRRGGLAHLARGETVLPSRAMAMDPSLRQHAMASMARQGRDPMQYTVGARNLRNPSSGLSQFADLIYTDQGYVDATTGLPADFAGGNSFANSGTNYSGPANFDPVTGRTRVASFGGLPTIAGRQIGDIVEFSERTPESQGFITSFGTEAGRTASVDTLAQPFRDARNQGITATPDMSPYFAGGVNPVYGAQGLPAAPQQPAPQQVQQQPSYNEWSTPNSYTDWRNTRNPQGKGFQDQLYGQAVGAGTGMGLDAQQSLAPNVLGTQIPVPMQTQWSTPGTALGFASDNNSDQPSILNSGYQQAVMMPYGPGAGAGWGGPGGGIAGPGIGGQQGGGSSRTRAAPNFQTAFLQY